MPSISQLAFSSSPSLITSEAELKSKTEVKHIVCLKFKDDSQMTRQDKFRSNVTDVSWLRRGSSDRGWDPVGMTKAEDPEEDGSKDEAKVAADEGVTWLVLDMRNEDSE